ncbi:hypothetical protein ACFE04_010076 [Oxalis oulophora]
MSSSLREDDETQPSDLVSESEDEGEEDVSDSEDEGETPVDSSSEKKRKKTYDPRGKAKCIRLRKMRESGKVELSFNNMLAVCGPNHKKYSSYLGMETRLYVPLNVISWDLVLKSDKDKVWETMFLLHN